MFILRFLKDVIYFVFEISNISKNAHFQIRVYQNAGNARSIWRYQHFNLFIKKSIVPHTYVWGSRVLHIFSYFGVLNNFTCLFSPFQNVPTICHWKVNKHKNEFHNFDARQCNKSWKSRISQMLRYEK